MQGSAVKSNSRVVIDRRILFDGAAVDTFADTYDLAMHDKTIEAEIVSETKDATAVSQAVSITHSVYVVTDDLQDLEVLTASIPPEAHLITINGEQNGVEQLAQLVQGYQGVTDLHILSHATDSGGLILGTSILNQETISTLYIDELEIISQALSYDADILLYGCELASSEEGQRTLEAVAAALNSDVAASDDLTGKDGDWELEFQIGGIETIEYEAPSWQGNLDLVPVISIPTISLFAEDQPLVFADLGVGQISVGDLNGSVAEVNLSVPLGSLSLTQTADVTLTEGTGSNDSTVTLVGSVADVNLALNSLIYTPDEDYNGLVNITVNLTDSFPIVPVTVTAYLPLTISPVADIVEDILSTPVDSAIQLNLMANDTFENSSAAITAVSSPNNGIITNDGMGNYTYTPDSGYHGSDSFVYTVTSNGTVESATVTLYVNSAPTANDSNSSVDEDNFILLDVAAQGNDIDGDSLTVSAPTLVSGQGTVSISSNQILYTPANNFSGTAEIDYIISDSYGGSDTATVTVTVNAVNDNPVANDTTGTGNEDTSITLNVLADVSDVDVGDTFSVSSPTVISGQGTVSIVNNEIVYVPALNFNGTAEIGYTVLDGNGGSDTATVSVTVNAVNDNPVANDTTGSGNEDTSITLNVLADVSDVDVGDTFTVSSPTVISGQGTVSIVNN
ncbi:Ig-like domain-containing protein, partial [Marinomonas epiphytica]